MNYKALLFVDKDEFLFIFIYFKEDKTFKFKILKLILK